MNVHSTDNNMVNVGTAYRVDFSSGRTVDILNNTLDTRRDGIVLNMNDGASHLLVENNAITFARNLPLGQYTKGYVGIRVNEANGKNTNAVIQNNAIQFRPSASTAYAGIWLTSANNYLVAGNTLLLSNNPANNPSNYAGIMLKGCESAVVSCNDVQGQASSFANLGQAGIRNWMGNNLLLNCNTVHKTTNGILFSGPASTVDLKGNAFHNHRWGLHLEGNAIIGEQLLNGNLWYEDAPVDGHQAWNENPENIPFVQFKVNPANPPPGAVFMPNNVEPPVWFVNDEGVNYDCEGNQACTGFGMTCSGCSENLW